MGKIDQRLIYALQRATARVLSNTARRHLSGRQEGQDMRNLAREIGYRKP